MAEQPPIHRHLRPKRAGLERNAKGPEADTITAAQDLLPPGLTKPDVSGGDKVDHVGG